MRNKIIKNISSIITIMIICKFFAFTREVLIANYYGTTLETDAFLMADTVAHTLFTLIGAGISTVFLPIYKTKTIEKGSKDANLFANKVISLYVLLSCFLVILGVVFSKDIAIVFAPRFSREGIVLTSNMIKLIMPQFIFIIISAIIAAMLQSKEQFLGYQLRELPPSFMVIISIFLFKEKIGIYALLVGSFLGSFFKLLIQLPFINWKYRFKIEFKFNDNDIKKMFFLMGPVILGTAVNQINILVDRMLASGLSVGSISALNYAGRLINVINSFLIISSTTIVFPMFTQNIIEKNFKKLARLYKNTIILLSIILAPITIISFCLKNQLIKIIFERGQFNSNATELTASIFSFYILSIIFIAIREVTNKVLYSFSNTKIPMLNSIFGVILNIILNIFLVKKIGAPGLALATSITALLTSLLLINSLKKTEVDYKFREIFKSLLKILLVSLISIFLFKKLENYILVESLFVEILLKSFLIILIYFIGIIVLKMDEVKFLKLLVSKNEKYSAKSC